MNSVTLLGKIEVVVIKDMDTWVRCGMKITNEKGLNTWFDVRGVKKTGKEIEFLPKLQGQYALVDARFSSYEKDGTTVYGIAASKSDVHKLPQSMAESLIEAGWNETVKLSGKIDSVKGNSEGNQFAKIGLRYMKPGKEAEAGYYYVRVACPPSFTPETHGAGSYVTALGTLGAAPDGRPLVKASYVG